MYRIFVVILLLPVMLFSQEEPQFDVEKLADFFVGTWTGVGEGQSGNSILERTYEYILRNNFVLMSNKAVFEPNEKNPEGEIHEDFGIFSFDKARETIVFRQYHVEGFYNQYVLDSAGTQGKVLVFTTEVIENGPAGLRAQITLEILGDHKFKERFALAFGDKEFTCYVENHFKRKQ